MKICNLCGKEFKTKEVIDGKRRNFQRRKYCLECSPFGSGNTAKLSRYGETLEDFNQIGKIKRRKKRNKEIYKKYQKQKREDRKKELVELRGGECKICSYDKCIASLDFHHRNQEEKEFEISRTGFLTKWETLVKEAEKCDILCKNCHNELHYLEKR